MKVFVITALLAVLACQLVAANTPSRTCTEEVVDRVKANVLDRVEVVQTRVSAIREFYNQCQTLPSNELPECHREFVNTTISYVRELYAQGVESRDEATMYLLARLDEYYACRFVGDIEIMAPRRETLCAVNLLRDARDQFSREELLALTFFNESMESFQLCVFSPDELQASCLVDLYVHVSGVLQQYVERLRESREELVRSAEVLLNQYYVCRKPLAGF